MLFKPIKQLYTYLKKRNHHNYTRTEAITPPTIVITQYPDGRETKTYINNYEYKCSYCDSIKYFSERWELKNNMFIFNKCKKGECI